MQFADYKAQLDEATKTVRCYETIMRTMAHELDARKQALDALSSDNAEAELIKSNKELQSEMIMCFQSVFRHVVSIN